MRGAIWYNVGMASLPRKVKCRATFAVGARGSMLSRLQAETALELLRREFPGTVYRLTAFSTPGDRDLASRATSTTPCAAAR